MENIEIKNSNELNLEQMKAVVSSLTEQNKNLKTKIDNMNLAAAFRRLDYLFMVVRDSDKFSKSFVKDCVKEIEEGLKIQEYKEEKK